jgi:hypothetical protein
LGQLIQSGTGFSEILLDEEKILDNLKSINYNEEEYLEIDESNIDIIMDVEEEDDDDCKDEDFKFSNE